MSDQLQQASATHPTDEEVEAQQRAGARRTALLLVLLMLLISGVAFWYLWNMRAAQSIGDETINVLLLGVTDEAADDTVDAIVMASLHPQTKAVGAVALPVNTVLPWAVRSPHLRDVYADGAETGLAEAVERLLGAPVHHTVRVDFSGFVELVDLFDGVPVNVLSEITYRDADGDIAFHLEPGLQRLDGRDALLYVRYKGVEDESLRVERQWRFVQDVVAEARASLGWEKVRPLLGLATEHVSTDLSLSDLTRLTQSVFDAESIGYAMHVLPGVDEDTGWVVDTERLASLSGEMFHNPSWEATAQ